jgi:hypothetical protein
MIVLYKFSLGKWLTDAEWVVQTGQRPCWCESPKPTGEKKLFTCATCGLLIPRDVAKSCPCPCGHEADPVMGAAVYPHRPDLFLLLFFKCSNCGRYCGAHGNGEPKGAPADAVTRMERREAHKWFDPLWMDPRELENPRDPKNRAAYEGGPLFESRDAAYRWLSGQFGVADAHIGHLSIEDVRRVPEMVRAFRQKVLDDGSRENH